MIRFITAPAVFAAMLFPAAAAAAEVDKADLAPGKQVVGPDRNILAFTGNTLPKGQMEFTAYDLAMWEFNYGITDRWQIGAFFSPSLLTSILLYNINARYQAVMNGPHALSVYMSYMGLASMKNDLVYNNAINAGLAYTFFSKRVAVNVPLLAIATDVVGSPDCDQVFDPYCGIRSEWTPGLMLMPGVSVLVAEPGGDQRVTINLEFMTGYAPLRDNMWFIVGEISLKWSDDQYLGEIGIEAPIASGFGRPTEAALRWESWVVPLLNFTVNW
jgi:hypothetical protein